MERAQKYRNRTEPRRSVLGHQNPSLSRKTVYNCVLRVCNAALKGTATPDWQRERERVLKMLVLRIATESNKGKSVTKLALRYSRRWNGQPFRCDPTHKLRLSAATLRRIFYDWKSGNSKALTLKFSSGQNRTVPKSVRLAVLRACKSPSVLSVADAVRGAQKQQTVNLSQHRATIYRLLRGIDFKGRRKILRVAAALDSELREINRRIQERINLIK